MTTNRTSLARRSAAQITPRAVEIFHSIKLFAAECSCRTQDDSCPACEAWWGAQSALGRELHLRPWQFPPAAEDPAVAVGWTPNESAQALWRELEAASERAEPRRGRRKREPVV
jgi:hypothetical protein